MKSAKVNLMKLKPSTHCLYAFLPEKIEPIVHYSYHDLHGAKRGTAWIYNTYTKHYPVPIPQLRHVQNDSTVNIPLATYIKRDICFQTLPQVDDVIHNK